MLNLPFLDNLKKNFLMQINKETMVWFNLFLNLFDAHTIVDHVI